MQSITAEQITSFLSKQRDPLTAREIARGIIGSTGNAKHVNPALYTMLTTRLVVKIDSSPPRWQLGKAPTADEQIAKETSPKRSRVLVVESLENKQKREMIALILLRLETMSIDDLTDIRNKMVEK